MELSDARGLINNGYFMETEDPTAWADLGCGSGLFTHALSGLLPPGSVIYAVDKRNPLKSEWMANGTRIIPLQADFEKQGLDLENLDGILMANSLHYVMDKRAFVERLKAYMSDHADFLVVEYDTDKGTSRWVPYPVGFDSLKKLFQDAGFRSVRKLSERPSIYGRANIYAAFISQ